MRYSFAEKHRTASHICAGRRALRGAWTLTLLVIVASATVAFAQEMPPPSPDGMFAVEGEKGTDPRVLLSEAQQDELVMTAGPQIQVVAEGPGWAYSTFPLYVVTGSTRPWRMVLDAGPMLLDGGGGEQISLTDVEARDGLTPTTWASLDGTALWQNLSGNPEQYLALEFRINVRPDHTAGHYVSQMTLNWVMPPSDGLPPATGTIPMELHLDVPEMFSVTTDVSSLTFPEDSGAAEGWIYSDTGHLNISTNLDYQVSLTVGEDLTGPDSYQIPTAMMLTNTTPAAPEWAAWGYLGDDAETLSTAPWAGDPDPDSPWPGTVGAVQQGLGDNTWDIDFGAWREGLNDPQGDYSTTIVITVALN